MKNVVEKRMTPFGLIFYLGYWKQDKTIGDKLRSVELTPVLDTELRSVILYHF